MLVATWMHSRQTSRCCIARGTTLSSCWWEPCMMSEPHSSTTWLRVVITGPVLFLGLQWRKRGQRSTMLWLLLVNQVRFLSYGPRTRKARRRGGVPLMWWQCILKTLKTITVRVLPFSLVPRIVTTTLLEIYVRCLQMFVCIASAFEPQKAHCLYQEHRNRRIYDFQCMPDGPFKYLLNYIDHRVKKLKCILLASKRVAIIAFS